MTLELTTRSRRRGTRARKTAISWASGLLVLVALTCVLPAALGLSSRTVSDDAMGSSMSKGSAVIVKAVPVADLQVGDVITYRGPAAGAPLLTRRIAEIYSGAVRTSGDGTGALDPWTLTLKSSTQDRAVAHVPFAGYVLDVANLSVRWWSAGFLALLIVALSLVGARSTRREYTIRPGLVAPLVPVPRPQDGTVVKPPRPRRGGHIRRRSSV